MFHKLLLRFNNREKIIIIYKLLNDALLLWLVFFVLTLIAEGLLPGLISSHLELYKIALIALANILLIRGIKNAAQIGNGTNGQNKKITYPLFFILGLLLLNSMFKLNIYLNLFILIAISVVGYFISKVLQEE